LHEESKEIFGFLEEVEEIQRMRRLDHLGAVRLAYDGAHHSRWEYVVTVLALIERAGALPRVQLKSEVRVAGKPIASSAEEMLKCWALLLNVGHLTWTFAAERVLLQELWRASQARRRFIRGLPVDLRSRAGRMFRDGDYYAFYQAIAVSRMERFSASHLGAPPWRELLLAYLLEPKSEQVERARRVFRRLRRVAYLGLDTQYAPGAVSLDLGRLLADDRTLERHALADRESDESELVALDAHMARTVYLSREVLSAFAAREERLRGDIRRALRDPRQVDTVIEQLAAGDYQHDLPASRVESAVRVQIRPVPPLDAFAADGINPRREEAAIRSDLRRRKASGIPVIWTVAERSEWVLQIHVETDQPWQAARALCCVLDRMNRYRTRVQVLFDFLDEGDLQEYLLGSVARDLIVAALRATFSPALRWEWGVTHGPTAAMAPRSKLRDLVTAEIRSLLPSAETRPRRAELELLYNMLLGEPNELCLASLSGLRGFRAQERVPLVELDCVVVRMRQELLEVHLGEAKTGSGSITGARRALQDKIVRLEPNSSARVDTASLMTRPLRKNQTKVRSRATTTARI
jgi:hypothetical protein